MIIKASSLAVIIAAFLVAGTLLWIGVIEEEDVKMENSRLAGIVSDEPIVVQIGWIGSLSGSNAAVGETIKRGVELAQKDLGVENIEIVFADVQCNIEDAIKAVDKLLLEENIKAIISAVCPTVGLAVNPIAQQSHVVIISPNNTSVQFTDTGDYIFRTIPSDLSFGEFAAKTVVDENVKNIAVLYSDDEKGIDSHKAFLEHWDGFVVSETFSPDATDFSVQLNNIKKIRPDGILIITNSKVSALAAIEQINRAGIIAKVFGSSVFSDQSFLSEIKAFPKSFEVLTASRGSAEFIARFKEVYNESPGLFAAQSYDAFVAVARSIEAGADSGPLIRDRLKTIQFEGASGYIQFDEKREVQDNWQVYSIENGLLMLKRSELIPAAN